MQIIATNENETIRIMKYGDRYIFQQRIRCINHWHGKDETKQEWLASKWIIDNGLIVGSDYPTIAEIRAMQRKKD